MKYTYTLRRELSKYSFVLDELRDDLLNTDNSKYWKEKFVMRMWLSGKGDWSYFGTSKVIRFDKDDSVSDKSWIQMIQKTYERVSEKSNRSVLGRRYFKKTPYPTSLVFFERGGETGGKHIHSLHHFPSRILDKRQRYIDTFRDFWITDETNNSVGRTFHFEIPRSQDDVSTYITKKMTDNYESGWFVVG